MVGDELARLCEKYRRGIVSIDSYLNRSEGFINIATDDFGGAYEMGKYLIRKGHTRIAMLADNDTTVDHHRWMGLQRAMEETGFMLTEKDHFLFSSSESVRELQFAQFLPDWKNYTALFVASDYYALEVSSFLQSRGIRVPEDISITGFDDLIYASLARPKLTTMSQNIGKKAKMAVEALLSLCEKKGEQKDIENLWEEKWQLPVKLVERESVSDRMYKNK